MMDKKKLHFYQLVFLFGAITIIALASVWGNSARVPSGMSMMAQSMGDMMRSMHLKDITIGDLIKQQEQMNNASVSSDLSSHHSENGDFLKAIHVLTTATIVILLPFIIAGTVFLTIIWLK